MEVVEKARRGMTFVLLQEAACSIPQGFLLQQRRDVVFSQAVGSQAEIIVLEDLPVGVHLSRTSLENVSSKSFVVCGPKGQLTQNRHINSNSCINTQNPFELLNLF